MPPSDEIKLQCERLSHSLIRASGFREVDKLLSQAGVLDLHVADVAASKSGQRVPRKIGIWQPRQQGGETWYVRDETGSMGLWANVERIGPKSERKRVILFGESVARGIFYDPFFTPAIALEKMLNGISEETIEVVDLARVDIGLNELSGLIGDALALQPDAIVIFAGNNWRFPGGSPNFDFIEKAAQLVEESNTWEPVITQIHEQLRSSIIRFLRFLGRIAINENVPIIFILPEFNLLDWSNEPCEQCPAWDSNEMIAWDSLRSEAARSLASGDLARAEECARRMLVIDIGCLANGYEILARCRLASRDYASARNFLELAKDASHALPINLAPRCYSVVQEIMRREAYRHGIHLVDLPRIFAHQYKDELPGRCLFLDYCHLTSEGVRLAMDAAARELFSAWKMSNKGSIEEWPSTSVQADKKLEAHAHFMAAVHNARCGQSYEIIRYHCEAALKYMPEIADTMKLYLEAHLQPVPLLMAQAFWKMCEYSRRAIAQTVRSTSRKEDISLSLVNAVSDALEPFYTGIKGQMDNMLRRAFELGKSSKDILLKPFCNVAVYRPERDWEYRTTCFYSYSRCTSINIAADKESVVRIDFTFRVPQAELSRGPVRVFIRENAIYTAEVLANWQKCTFFVPGTLICDAPTELVIEWPEPSWTKEQRIEGVVSNMVRGPIAGAFFPDVLAVFGEIQSLIATLLPSPLPPAQSPALNSFDTASAIQ